MPERITVWFWAIKILTTGMGESLADFMAHRYNPFLAGAVSAVAFAVAMAIQFSTRRYNAWAYWFAVAMVAVFGTMGADGLHIQFGIPYTVTTAFWAVVLAVIFVLWQRSEGTLSIHSIYTARREGFYWLTVLATFALGTAVGDLLAVTLHLGYLASGILFTVLFLATGAAYRSMGLHAVLAFWTAYVLTRPLGASFADWMGVPHSLGGLGLGRGMTTVYLAVPMVVLVAIVAITRLDVVDEVRPVRR